MTDRPQLRNWLMLLASCLALGCEPSPAPEPSEAETQEPVYWEPVGFEAGACPEALEATGVFIQTAPFLWRLVSPVFEKGCGRYQAIVELFADDDSRTYRQQLRICNLCDERVSLKLGSNSLGFSWVDATGRWVAAQALDADCGQYQCDPEQEDACGWQECLPTLERLDASIEPGQGGILRPAFDFSSESGWSYVRDCELIPSLSAPIRMLIHLPRLWKESELATARYDAQWAVGSAAPTAWEEKLGRALEEDELYWGELSTVLPLTLARAMTRPCGLSPWFQGSYLHSAFGWETSKGGIIIVTPPHLDGCGLYSFQLIEVGETVDGFKLWGTHCVSNRCPETAQCSEPCPSLSFQDHEGRELWFCSTKQRFDRERLFPAHSTGNAEELVSLSCAQVRERGLNWGDGVKLRFHYAPMLPWPRAARTPPDRQRAIGCALANGQDLDYQQEELRFYTLELPPSSAVVQRIRSKCNVD
ncbi:MAG: hypothetical protein RBU37_21065 [Myxococcota bacterium]|nr:hypothetical protein [Myxococcota bacterium]